MGVGTTHPVKLIQYVTTQGANLNNVETITGTYNAFAEVKRLGAGRQGSNGQTLLFDTVEFKIRFSFDFNPTGAWNIIYGGNTHKVNSITKDKEQKFYWIISAQSKGVR